MINSIRYKISKIITHNNTFKADKSVEQVCGLNACYVDAQKVRGGKMKTNKIIISMLSALMLVSIFASCASNRSITSSDEEKIIFNYAHHGILPSYLDYFGKEPEYEVHGPRNTDELDKKHGWNEACTVTCEAEETVYRIRYVKNLSWTIDTVEIFSLTDDLFLGKYVGKPKNVVLEDFPNGWTDNGYAIFYESQDFLISFIYKKEKIYYINILTRTEKAERDSARRPEKIDTDEIQHSPLIAKNITLDGTNWIKTQFKNNLTGKPISNRRCIIYVIQGYETFEIHTKTDENGWIYVINLPDGEYYFNFENDV